MKFSDIKVKHIYNVDFNPVRECEFNGKHLALVLKHNNDKRTFVVMPLTSTSSGVGTNKIHIGKIESLPSSLKSNETYAVFNQIRTVNANRFYALKENEMRVESKVDDILFDKLLRLGIQDLLFDLEYDEKSRLLRQSYDNICVAKAIDLAYNIKRLQQSNGNEEEISRIEQEIKGIISDVPLSLEQRYIDDGIKNIFDDILKIV